MSNEQKISYESKKENEFKILTYVIENRHKLKPFREVMGNVPAHFLRKGFTTDDNQFMYFTEYGDAGNFSYLIIDNYDVIDNISSYYIEKLIKYGIVEFKDPSKESEYIAYYNIVVDELKENLNPKAIHEEMKNYTVVDKPNKKERLKMKYKISEYDPVHDIWLLEKRFLFIFWIPVTCGSKKALEKFLDENKGEK